MCELNTNMLKVAFLPVIIAVITAAILSPSVVTNTFAKSSDGDSVGGGSNGDGGGDKPKTSAHKEDEGSGNHLVAPGSPVEVAKDKHKQQNNDGSNGGLIAPGVPVPPAANGGGDNSGWGYNNGNIKNFDTSKSSFRIGGSDGKIVQYKPGL
jgi:hypothetical protein